ncbi:MAG: SDR family oxidoreductase [Cyclobacteriaceae bacterium]|nr:SDR family oxidoreductase [Cyclobacteriaceae bacterium]
MHMKNKVVLITGATSGIGKALAFEFGWHGSKVAITGRREKELNEVKIELEKQGVACLTIVGDVSVEADAKRMVDDSINHFGSLDVLINNAGISMRALFQDIELAVFKKVMDINFYGTVYCTKYALPHILKTKGSIVGISSINGRRATPARSAYSASKYAMEGFLEAIRMEVMKKDVHVLSVCPGFTASNIRNTALTADGSVQGESPREEQKMMSAEETAQHIYKAVMLRKRDLILTFQGKLAVWLSKWMPGTMDKITYNFMAKEPDSPLK